MGWGSYQEDNLDAKGKSIRKERAVKSENSSYEFKGKPLTQEIAKTILIQIAEREKPYDKRNSRTYLPLQKWAEYVSAYHIKHGGLPAKGNLINVVGKALITGRSRTRSFSGETRWKIF